ncbi:MAG TPA: type II secretion system secretin GspD [Pseudolabrys sp.]|nr:type II secretion system secretin GspD [Pseudolabrys sp.]
MAFEYSRMIRCQVLVPLVALALVGCQTTEKDKAADAWASALPLRADTPAGGIVTIAAASPSDTSTQDKDLTPRPAGPQKEKISFLAGTGRFIGDPPTSDRSAADPSEGTITVNLVGVSVAQAAKAVLGDMLGVKYTIDAGIDGKVTIQTPRPVPKSSAINLFQMALRSNNATVIEAGDQYKIVAIDQAAVGANIRLNSKADGEDNLGSRVQIVQLQYVSPAEIKRLIEPISPRGAIVRADEARHTVTLSGTGPEIAGMLDAISLFDVDVMRGMSFALVPVTTAQPDAVADQLREVFSADREGPMAGMVRFVANKQLSAVLVISPQTKYLKRAAEWVRRFDAQAEGSEKQFFTYTAQNRPAQELVDVLQSMFGREAGATRSNNTRNVAPGYREANVQSGGSSAFPSISGASMGGGASQGGGLSQGFGSAGGLSQIRPQQTSAKGLDANPGPPAPVTGDGTQDQRFRIAVDEGKNAILIEATPVDYRRIMKVVKSLDVMPKQVIIEVTIAEVSLNDELKFGVRWFLTNKNGGAAATFSDAATGAIGSVFPGFSYALTAANLVASLNALNSITDVNVVSSPSLTVMDNHTAYLQIGDEVPITTQTAVSTLTTGAPVVNSVSYKDTGVILAITPRINASGRVLLDLEQEVSSVVPTTSSGIDSPTIRQRRIRTSVVVNNGEGLALGGLMEHGNTVTRSQVPLLGDIPALGNAFKTKDNTADKTELIILITPMVMRTLNEARWITDEFRRELRRNFPPPVTSRSMEQTFRRTFE